MIVLTCVNIRLNNIMFVMMCVSNFQKMSLYTPQSVTSSFIYSYFALYIYNIYNIYIVYNIYIYMYVYIYIICIRVGLLSRHIDIGFDTFDPR